MIYKKTYGWRIKDRPELYSTEEEAKAALTKQPCNECACDPCECEEEEWKLAEETLSMSELLEEIS